jgi:hypothetical protein
MRICFSSPWGTSLDEVAPIGQPPSGSAFFPEMTADSAAPHTLGEDRRANV